MMLLLASLFVAQAGSAAAPCREPSATCDPWDAVSSPTGTVTDPCNEQSTTCDPWADFRKTKPAETKYLAGPYVLIVMLRGGGGTTQIRYKSGRACAKAAHVFEPPDPIAGQVRLPTVPMAYAYCVPLNP